MSVRFQTQSELDPGNCWQTAVACLLDLDAAELPPQKRDDVRGSSYHNRLNAYLFHHHGKCYVEIGKPFIDIVGPPEFHVLVGPTVRTTTEHPVLHVVVAARGQMIWDVHPSRAGLTAVEHWGIVAPIPAAWRDSWEKGSARGDGTYLCRCPKCEGDPP